MIRTRKSGAPELKKIEFPEHLMYSPIVDQLQVESVTGDSTVAILQGMAASQQQQMVTNAANQQQIIQLLTTMTALFNTTE